MFKSLSRWILGRQKLNADIKAASEAPRLHGVNLNTWQYLGRSEASYSYTGSKNKDIANIFFFCKKDNTNTRKFVVIYESSYLKDVFKTHPFITVEAELWKVGERNLYYIINRDPSVWLKEQLLEQHQCVWSNENKSWISNDESRYESAKKTQTKSKSKKEILPEEDNVVKVEFSKPKG